MKKWMVLLLTSIVLLTVPASAFLVESGYVKQPGGQYVKMTKISCETATSSHCQSLCQNPTACQRPEPYCRNCAGTTSPLLRQLFTEISKTYAISQELNDRQVLVKYLGTERYVLLDIKSVFNYYTPVGGEAFAKELGAFCGDSAESALLAVKLDEVHQPMALSYVLCRNNAGQTSAFEVQPRQPGIGNRPLSAPIIFKLN
ncbi:hypothetical protein EP01_10735 [Bdellovibrio bacteriovorus]|uniref:hypothetical protein n=1 Tax=Bdellovibrio bacteriovorus TaxID=959 RepID=UPI00045C02A1|nr:hypothetical protein [Bdellovibrio bacteriovorus]AHZ85411.1 hypothetical protein EP01_10735 [Bdellovibrio bacteriovorus]